MKPTSHVVRNLYAAFLRDAAHTVTGHDQHVELQDFVRDSLLSLDRLVDLVEHRGVQVIMKDLPAFGKLVDSGLSSGLLKIADIPHSLGNWKKGTVLFQSSIFSSLFGKTGNLLNPTPDEVLMARQLCYMAKRVKMESSQESVRDAVKEYFDIEAGLRDPYLHWGKVELYKGNPCRWDLTFVGSYLNDEDFKTDLPQPIFEVLDKLTAYYTPREEVDLYEVIGRHGSGAVADVRSGDDKYSFPGWPKKLQAIFPYEVLTFHREGLLPLLAGSGVYQPDDSEVPARLSAVPKTLDKPRLITIEPTAHQFLQQGLLRWIRQKMNPSLCRAIDFFDQTVSQELTLKASADTENATVDLSAASDRLTCWTVERCFCTNPSFLKSLNACRSHLLVDGTAGADSSKVHELRKFAGMGSAVTFPVQTIIYACVAATAVLYDRGWKVVPRNYRRAMGMVRVFGDDIILPSSSVPTLARLLDALQLRVNASKTHWLGHFRESCGKDAWCGYDVTPTYLSAFSLAYTQTKKRGKTKLRFKAENLASWIDTANNLWLEGWWNMSAWMEAQLPAAVRAKIPVSNGNLGGMHLRSFSHGTLGCKRRFNLHLHHWEYKGFCLSTRRELRRRENARSLLQYFAEAPSIDPVWVTGREPASTWMSGWVERDRVTLVSRWVPFDWPEMD